jgi:hypothetical protein
VATGDDLSKPSALYCFRAETAAARAWFLQQTGRAPEQKYPSYALFLGHHDVYSTETDVYLVPRERLRA